MQPLFTTLGPCVAPGSRGDQNVPLKITKIWAESARKRSEAPKVVVGVGAGKGFREGLGADHFWGPLKLAASLRFLAPSSHIFQFFRDNFGRHETRVPHRGPE